MTTTSAASTLGAPWNRRVCEVRSRSALQPMPAGALMPPAATMTRLAAGELPRGRILVVEDDALLALDLQRMLRDGGYRVIGPAASAAEIQQLIDRKAVDCAIVDLDLDQQRPVEIADLLADAGVPFVLLTTGWRWRLPTAHWLRPVVEKPFCRAALLAAIERALKKPPVPTNDNNRFSGSTVVPWERIYPAL